ncbi:MAG: hypothetical protein LBK95_04825 [Bifidobacteriaceae bacterium]|jgi:hypothetical protein|nr:hypothetical protein [Bifidobacteriaceae bacterium]
MTGVSDQAAGVLPAKSTHARTYRYDRAGRLSGVDVAGVEEAGKATCRRVAYSFDANGNRTGQVTNQGAGGQVCGQGGTVSKTWTHDSADRVQTGTGGQGAYVYDGLGRQTAIPGIDTPGGAAAGNLAISYYADDSARALVQGGTTAEYTLDPAGRRSVETAVGKAWSGAGSAAQKTVVKRHYTDGSDNPDWVETASGGTTTVTRYETSIGGDLGVEATTGQPARLTLADPHGDVVSTVTIPANGAAPEGIDSYATWDE